MKIITNTVVHNEENFIWYSLMSVAPYVDQMLVWDTGSSDKTVQIIKEVQKIFKNKILFREKGLVNKHQFTKVRQQMLDQSDGDWILILDGDEVWWETSIEKLVKTIKDKGQQLDSIAVPFYNAAGDIYHHQEQKAGKYKIGERVGHLTIRAINKKIPGLHVGLPYGSEGFFDDTNTPIQNRQPKRLMFLEAPFLHLTHLQRSSKSQKTNKYKYDLGQRFPDQMKVPEVFLTPGPKSVSSALYKRDLKYRLISTVLRPLQKIRRWI